MSITWLSTLSPIRMLDEPISKAIVKCLIANRGVDSALLAAELKLGQQHVEAFQRRLGLRKCEQRKNTMSVQAARRLRLLTALES